MASDDDRRESIHARRRLTRRFGLLAAADENQHSGVSLAQVATALQLQPLAVVKRHRYAAVLAGCVVRNDPDGMLLVEVLSDGASDLWGVLPDGG